MTVEGLSFLEYCKLQKNGIHTQIRIAHLSLPYHAVWPLLLAVNLRASTAVKGQYLEMIVQKKRERTVKTLELSSHRVPQ